MQASLVVLPRYGQAPQVRSVFIGTENTYTKTRYRHALAKAVALRKEAEALYVEAATLAKRNEAKHLRAALASERAA